MKENMNDIAKRVAALIIDNFRDELKIEMSETSDIFCSLCYTMLAVTHRTESIIYSMSNNGLDKPKWDDRSSVYSEDDVKRLIENIKRHQNVCKRKIDIDGIINCIGI